ncbi:MAG TPA: rhodanese-like domain-containing protein, partial [Candidatus Dormibacteraeota bacterium]|nr:rhodanese-like domain-containing protein [Candidatus Dormibacteraeota bacterium]
GPARRSHLKTSLSLRPPLDCVLSAAEMLDAVQRRTRQPLDARAPERYRGEIEPIDPVAGHIPGAKNRPFALNYRADGHFRSPEELRAQFAAYGSDERLVHYCGSGISASVNLLAAHLAGVPDGCIYAGSWSEWCANDSRPIERG